jgi:hypothetical protein
VDSQSTAQVPRDYDSSANGEYRWEDEAGRLLCTGSYLAGERVGSWTYYYTNGLTAAVGSFDLDCQRNDAWYMTGRKRLEERHGASGAYKLHLWDTVGRPVVEVEAGPNRSGREVRWFYDVPNSEEVLTFLWTNGTVTRVSSELGGQRVFYGSFLEYIHYDSSRYYASWLQVDISEIDSHLAVGMTQESVERLLGVQLELEETGQRYSPGLIQFAWKGSDSVYGELHRSPELPGVPRYVAVYRQFRPETDTTVFFRLFYDSMSRRLIRWEREEVGHASKEG